MQIIETVLPEVKIIEPRVFPDARGFFLETFHAEKYLQAGIETTFVQDNHSRSCRGTLRGLHFQLHQPQGKLCRVASGRVWDVAVDIRHGSPRFGQWVGVELSDENQRQIWVPRGFAHGFLVLSEFADFLYKCDDFYDGNDDCGVAWDDDEIGVAWPIGQMKDELILSPKDKIRPRLSELSAEQLPDYNTLR